LEGSFDASCTPLGWLAVGTEAAFAEGAGVGAGGGLVVGAAGCADSKRGAAAPCVSMVNDGAVASTSPLVMSALSGWGKGIARGGGGCVKVTVVEVGKVDEDVRLMRELMALSCWLRVGWQGANS
jgi:hypothetical protein